MHVSVFICLCNCHIILKSFTHLHALVLSDYNTGFTIDILNNLPWYFPRYMYIPCNYF